MGSALLKTWALNLDYQFDVIDPSEYKNIKQKNKKKIRGYKSSSEIHEYISYKIVIFAIKPQQAANVLNDLSNFEFSKNTIFISIIAGIKISFFNKFFPKINNFIRAMPNMPALINEGMTCLVCNNKINLKNKKIVESFFSKNGKIIWLKKETEIDKVTAISGSGPGYIFFLIDAFENAALELGLTKDQTQKIVHQTVLGSVLLFSKGNKTAKELTNNIAVKGGTTEAGLKEFKKNKILHKLFKSVIKSAHKKAIKIGK